MRNLLPWVRAASRILHHVEDGLLSVILVSMVVLSFSQIVLRNFFNLGLVWADPLLRQMVMWAFLVGAAIATRDHNHINVNIIARFLPGRVKAGVQTFTDLFATVICGILTYTTFQLVSAEFSQPFEEPLMGFIPMWVSMSILPVAFFLFTVRFFRFTVTSFLKTIGTIEIVAEEEPEGII